MFFAIVKSPVGGADKNLDLIYNQEVQYVLLRTKNKGR